MSAGDCDNAGNDAADRLAKDAACPGKTHPFRPLLTRKKAFIRGRIRAQWEQEWKSTAKGSYLRRIGNTLPASLMDGMPHPSTLGLEGVPISIPRRQFKYSHPGCDSYFKRRKTLDRHLKNYLAERPHICWVPGCQRSFSRRDIPSAHYTTHGRRGGRNRYMATLDKTDPVYNPYFCEQLTPQVWPLRYAGRD